MTRVSFTEDDPKINIIPRHSLSIQESLFYDDRELAEFKLEAETSGAFFIADERKPVKKEEEQTTPRRSRRSPRESRGSSTRRGGKGKVTGSAALISATPILTLQDEIFQVDNDK